ncbi:hypothetical protein IPM44_00545 [bacterium]|nr:MAG: hypothetical protein IPM44_00545 [bacterium]
MPNKSIDSIGPKPNKNNIKPVAEHRAGEVVRPKGAPTQAGESIKPKGYQAPKKLESTVGKPDQPKRPVNKKKVAVFAGFVGLFILVSLAAVWLLRGTNLLNSVGKPKPAAGNFAEVGDQASTLDEFNKVKDAYQGFNKKQATPADSQVVAANASRDLITYLALKSEAVKQGVECTWEIVDTRMATQYQSYGGKEAFYAYLAQEYGWSKEVSFMKTCTEYYREVLAQKVIGGTDAFGVYIRWDNMDNDSTAQQRATYEQEAKARLERDFLPLFKSGASKEEIYRAADISPYSTDVEFDKKMETPGSPWVRTVEYPRLNETTYASFQQYPEGERDIDYISKLAVGENTVVFKSKVGYYAIFRATNRIQGEAGSIDQVIQKYIDGAKLSTEYYALPKPSSNGQEQFDMHDLKQDNTTGMLDSMRQALVPTARAVNCFTNHRLPMSIIYTDYATGQLIPLEQIRTNKGAPISTLQILSTGNVQAACNDEPAPIQNAYGVLNFGYWAGRASWDVFDHRNNPWAFNLSCYTSWEFRFNKVYGYEQVNYQDASQFEVTLLTNQWIVQNRASAYTDHYRIPPDLYQGIANGALGYSINVRMRKEPPTTGWNPPLMTVSGEKQEEDGTTIGAYADNTVSEQPNNFTSSGQPYSFPGLRADQGHVFTVETEPNYDVLGYRINGGPINQSTTYTYVAGTTGDGTTLDVDWIFRRRPTVNLSVTCALISGNVIGGGGATIETYARVGGADLVDGAGQRIIQGRNFSFTVPEAYKDGVGRTVELRLIVDGVDWGAAAATTLSCNRNALCSNNNLGTVFPGNRVTIGVGGQEEGISIAMSNNGESIWSTYSTGTYQLVLTPEADIYWDIVAGTSVPAGEKIYPQPNPISGKTFAPITVTLTASPSDSTTPLGFQMAFIPDGGGAAQRFGTACSTELRVLSSYGPWLRTQNGNVSAMGVIKGQEALSLTGGNLGGRRAAGSAGTTADGQKDDINLEATYLLLSKVAGNGPFCSTNAYILGRDGNAGTMSDLNSCDFKQYNFALRANLERALSAQTPVSEELIYREAFQAYDDAPTSCPSTGPEPSGPARYVNGGTYDGSGALPGISANNCPTIRVLDGVRDGSYKTLGANPSLPLPVVPMLVTSRGTVLVDGDLYINTNIVNAPSAPSFNRDDLNALNQLPNLGIIVKGNIIIDKDVTRIDASLYASGKIKTCENLYNPSSSTENDPNTSNGFKLEGGTVAENTQAARCSKQLKIHGVMASKGGFMLGRNFVDFSAMAGAGRIGRSRFSADFEYDARRGLYYGQPAEDVVFNGLMLILPPPGFEHLSNPDFFQARYTSESAQPRF